MNFFEGSLFVMAVERFVVGCVCFVADGSMILTCLGLKKNNLVWLYIA